jgi:hypothetical protein
MAKEIPSAWIIEKESYLRQKLPQNVQQGLFLPDAIFYIQYYQQADKSDGLHYMASILFNRLKIEPKKCIIDFYSEKDFPAHKGDTAGFYVKINQEGEEKEVIFINSKHKGNALAVGAILAHEMMHLYLDRLNIRLDDIAENELLTDLATIETGLSILILNGMSYSSQWWLTIILLALGRIYWSSQQLAFGYFKPHQYGRNTARYLREGGIKIEEVLGYLNPSSRGFMPHNRFSRVKPQTEFIRLLQKQHLKSNLIKGSVAAVVVVGLISWSVISGNKKDNLNIQISSCQSEISLLENKTKMDRNDLDNMNTQLDNYKNLGDTDSYNNLVVPHNKLLTQVQAEYADYQTKLSECNSKINEYNQQ